MTSSTITSDVKIKRRSAANNKKITRIGYFNIKLWRCKQRGKIENSGPLVDTTFLLVSGKQGKELPVSYSWVQPEKNYSISLHAGTAYVMHKFLLRPSRNYLSRALVQCQNPNDDDPLYQHVENILF